MDDDHREIVPALQSPQIGEDGRDVTGVILIDTVQAHERIEQQHPGSALSYGLGEAALISFEIKAHGSRGNHVDGQRAQVQAAVAADAREARFDDAGRVLGHVEEHASRLDDRERPEAAGRAGGGNGHPDARLQRRVHLHLHLQVLAKRRERGVTEIEDLIVRPGELSAEVAHRGGLADAGFGRQDADAAVIQKALPVLAIEFSQRQRRLRQLVTDLFTPCPVPALDTPLRLAVAGVRVEETDPELGADEAERASCVGRTAIDVIDAR
jgi:hypothetical protein